MRRGARTLLVVGALAAQTSITIYNDGRVLVRREMAMAVPKGASNHKIALGSLDPASLFPLDSSVAITRLTYDGATDEGSVLRRSVGRRVVFRLPESKDTLSALVLGVDPLRLQLPDGRVTFQPPGAALYPELFRWATHDLRLRDLAGGDDFDIMGYGLGRLNKRCRHLFRGLQHFRRRHGVH